MVYHTTTYVDSLSFKDTLILVVLLHNSQSFMDIERMHGEAKQQKQVLTVTTPCAIFKILSQICHGNSRSESPHLFL